MAKYRKKPTVIEAVQWHPDPEFGSFKMQHGRQVWHGRKSGYDKHGVECLILDVGLRTAHGFAHLKDGDWICRQTVNGQEDVWPVKKDIFAAMYEPV